jgi:hypothetical protein
MRKRWAVGICAAAMIVVAAGGAGVAAASPSATPQKNGEHVFTVYSSGAGLKSTETTLVIHLAT